MLFPTASFAVFFVLVFIGGWVLFTGRTSWRIFMLAASLLFCALFDVRFLWLFVATIVVGWAFIKLIELLGPGGSGARAALAASVALHVGVLIYFKQLGFFASSVQNLLGVVGIDVGWNIVQIAIPVGISFLIFRGISATVDVYRGDAEPPSFLDYALFLTFFPYVAAGPVVRLRETIPQWLARRDPTALKATQGFLLFLGGLAKKLLVADYLARVVVDDVFAAPALHSAPDVLLGVYGYAMQIYCDFSGYTDMAIGVALLLGIALPQNFNAPYIAVSLQDFWRRWHITLSRFLRDYVYIPLGGNRRGLGRTYFNIVATMFIGGLWHGAGATFAIWGLLHGAGQAFERWLAERTGKKDQRFLPAPIQWFTTFNFVALAWIFFRAETAGIAFSVIGRVFTGWGAESVLPQAAWLFIAGTLTVQFIPEDWRERLRITFWRLAPAWQGVSLALALFLIAALGPEGPTAFIYAGF